MGDTIVIDATERNVLHNADSGAMRFQVRVPLPGLGPAITFIAKHDSRTELYRIVIGRQTKVVNLTTPNHDVKTFRLNNMDFQQFHEFWITWYNKKLRMGVGGEDKPYLVYTMHTDYEIGYVQFNTVTRNWAPVEWIIESSPVVLKPVTPKVFEGDLHWVEMVNGRVPAGAMIGGFENEPVYIARAHHNNSLCPGKYVPSMRLAYVPWGHREHSKNGCEILCGHNAIWVKTKQNYIPTNAFIGGRSEVNNEPLYIGRAIHDGKLIPGKVHTRYKTCYLPYNGKEIEVSSYEILVVPQNAVPQALPFNLM